MADYYSILKKTISGLGKNTPEIRTAVYEKARVAIEKQLRGLSPAPNEDMIAQQLDSLEQAIKIIDGEYADSDAEAATAASDEADAPVSNPVDPVATESAEVKPDPSPEQNTPDDALMAAAASTPAASVASSEPAQAETSFEQTVNELHSTPPEQSSGLDEAMKEDVSTVSSPVTPVSTGDAAIAERPAHQTTSGALDAMSTAVKADQVAAVADNGGPSVSSDPRVPELPARQPKKGLGRFVFPLIVVAVLGGVGYAGWANKDVILDASNQLVADVTQPQDEPSIETSDDKSVEKEPVRIGADGEDASADPVDEQATANEQTDLPATSDTEPEVTEDTTTENTTEQPVEQAAIAPVEDEQVTQPSVDDATVTEPEQPEATQQQPVVEPVDEGTEQAAVEPAIVPIGEIAYLYEEGSAGSGATRTNAGVSWSVERQQIEQGSTPEPVIIGKMEVPEKDLSVDITIKRNVDEALSASHLIELRFNTPDGFAGQGIDEIARFVMKTTEEARGEALVAVPVKVSEGFFLIALDNLPQAVEVNTQLLSSSSWIDVPLSYVTGKRALLTLEKGNSGAAAFEQAFNDWRNR